MVPAVTKAPSPRWCTLATHHITAGLNATVQTSAEQDGRSGVWSAEASVISAPRAPGGRRLILVTRDSGAAGLPVSPAMSQHALGS